MNEIDPDSDSINSPMESVCDLKYLKDMMGGKNHLILGVIEAFLMQIPEELHCINEAVAKTDYAVIKKIAHTMKSTVSIMGIAVLGPILQEMENYGSTETNIEKTRELNEQLNLICNRAVREAQIQKLNYI